MAFLVAALIFIVINWALAVLAHKLEAWMSTRQAGHVLHLNEDINP